MTSGESRTGGEVAAGFEPVRAAFEQNLADLGDGGGGFAAFLDGSSVVDLWGGRASADSPWARDTLAVIMSATKGLVTVCAQILADRGSLDIEAPVAEYWPEFARAGKERVTVRHVLTHTSGVLGFGDHPPPLQWDGTGWDDYDGIAAALAASAPRWTPGERFGYHATTYGWLVGEIVRRITGQTVGAFFRDNVAGPLGLDAWIGTPPSERARVATLEDHTRSGLPLPMRLIAHRFEKQMRDPSTLAGQAYLGGPGGSLLDHAQDMLNKGSALSVEMPFGNGTATATSLARLYATLSLGGQLDDVRILSPKTVALFSTQAISLPDSLLTDVPIPGVRWFMAAPVRRTPGFLLNPALRGEKPRFGPNPRSYGHDGAGGQIAFCDPDRRLGIGFVRSDLSSSGKFSLRLIRRTYQCLDTR